MGGFPGAAAMMGAPGRMGPSGGYGFNGGGVYPNIFLNYPPGGYGGYGYGGGYDPLVASAQSGAYFTYGNTSYTTESPSPIPVYAPRPPFASLPPPMPLTALLKVHAPYDAEIWLDGRKMRSSGPMRHYRSPPLNPSKEYAYEVRARWLVNNKPIEDVRYVIIHAGSAAFVDFTHLDPQVPRPSEPPPPPSPPPTKSK